MITSLAFVYILLPLSIAAAALAPRHLRPCALLLTSLVLYLLTEPHNLPVLLAVILSDYLVVRLMEVFDQKPLRRICFWFSVLKDLGFIAFTSAMVQISGQAAPLGFIIYTLSALSCVIDIYNREVPYEHNILDFALICAFFPKLYAGPLGTYSQLMPCVKAMKAPRNPGQPLFELDSLIEGGSQFVFGLAKVVILGGYITQVYNSLSGLPVGKVTVVSAWSMLICLVFSVYFNLLGYCDIAAGIGKILGLPLPKNFHYPFQASGMGDFFERFNSSVSAFIRKYVYVNLDEDKNGFPADSLNLLVVGMLMGLYFGFRMNYLLWGAYLALHIILERYLLKPLIQRIPTFFRRIITFAVVLTSFAIYNGQSFGQVWLTVRQMFNFGLRLKFVNNSVLYILSSNWILLLLCIFFSTSAVDALIVLLRKYLPPAGGVFSVLLAGGILVLTTAFML